MLMEMDLLVVYLLLWVVEIYRKKIILGNDYVLILVCVCICIIIDFDFGVGWGGLLVKLSCELVFVVWVNFKLNFVRFYVVKYWEIVI